jgi:SAM-dependent methyltransferase
VTDESALDDQRTLWTIGDYPAVARHLFPLSVDALDAAGIVPGTRLLDVGVGDGNTAIEAARRGAAVTGVDLTPAQLERARARAEAEGVAVTLDEGNAEDLPYPDGEFDVVVSVVGVIFAPDAARAARELARVCRPGGTVVVVSWSAAGGFPEVWRRMAGELLPSVAEQMARSSWGDPAELADLLGGGSGGAGGAGLDVVVRPGSFHWRFPSTAEARDFFLATAGGFITFDEAVASAGRPGAVRESLLAAMDEANEATDGTCVLPAPYLLAVGRRPAEPGGPGLPPAARR